MAPEYSFSEQLELGKKGEDQVYKYLRSKPDTVDVRDLSDSSHWQPLGIDALWIRENQTNGILYATFLDVKTDMMVHKTGGLFIETASNSEKAGNMLTTKAEYFLYYDPVLGKLYYIPIHALRKWYLAKGKAKKHYPVKNAGYESEGFVLMLDEAPSILGYVEVEDCPILDLGDHKAD